jgi:hypothetical protein
LHSGLRTQGRPEAEAHAPDLLTSLEEVRTAAAQVARAASRMLTIHTHDLESQIFTHPPFLAAVKRLVLGRRYAKVRVLILDPARVHYEHNDFVTLARKLTSYIELRHAQPPYRDNPASFMVADDCATLCRLQHTRWEGIVDLKDKVAARSFLDRFDEVWVASAPEAPASKARG